MFVRIFLFRRTVIDPHRHIPYNTPMSNEKVNIMYGNGSEYVKNRELQDAFNKLHAGEVVPYAAPKNLKEISEELFFSRLAISPCHGQVKGIVDGQEFQAFVQNPHDMSGVGFMRYWGTNGREQKFYQFSACDHEYVGVSRGRCYTVYTCKKCNVSYSIDSSD